MKDIDILNHLLVVAAIEAYRFLSGAQRFPRCCCIHTEAIHKAAMTFSAAVLTAVFDFPRLKVGIPVKKPYKKFY